VRTARPDEEHELDSRLRDRDRTIENLNLRLRELTGVLRKEQATRDLLTRQVAQTPSRSLSKSRPQRNVRLAPQPKRAKRTRAKIKRAKTKHGRR
jgi:hypothetical protein